MTFMGLVLVFVAALAAIPAGLFLIEVLAAVFGEERLRFTGGDRRAVKRPKICVLVPAHDEAEGIGATVSAILQQLVPGDRLLVVADNCTDNTAAVAAEAGADVVVRHDPSRRGKGYALAFGIDLLRGDPPECVIVMDADCIPGERLIDTVARRCAETGRPVQARYDMIAPAGSPPEQAVAAFAWLVRNHVRPLGLAALNLPCQLMGTGMAFPWDAIARANLASGHIVEDLKLGLDLAASGYAPVFESGVAVVSTFARSEKAMVTQRRRWETGALMVLADTAPKTAWAALKSADLKLLVLALDAMVPPMVPFIALLTVIATLSAAFGVACASLAPLIASVPWLTAVTGLVLAWFAFGKRALTLPGASALAAFVLRKLRIYQRPEGWVRTGRD